MHACGVIWYVSSSLYKTLENIFFVRPCQKTRNVHSGVPCFFVRGWADSNLRLFFIWRRRFSIIFDVVIDFEQKL